MIYFNIQHTVPEYILYTYVKFYEAMTKNDIHYNFFSCCNTTRKKIIMCIIFCHSLIKILMNIVYTLAQYVVYKEKALYLV